MRPHLGDGPADLLEPTRRASRQLLMNTCGLTEREQDVTRLVVQRDSTAQIAERLFVSPHTVQEHLKHIFDKTGAQPPSIVCFTHLGRRHPFEAIAE